VTEVVDTTPHAPPAPPRSKWHRLLLGPGFIRAAWMTALFFWIGFGIVVGLRSIAHYDPALDWLIIVTVAGLITAPLGFLGGILRCGRHKQLWAIRQRGCQQARRASENLLLAFA